jgi:hypothetical protein
MGVSTFKNHRSLVGFMKKTMDEAVRDDGNRFEYHDIFVTRRE